MQHAWGGKTRIVGEADIRVERVYAFFDAGELTATRGRFFTCDFRHFTVRSEGEANYSA